MINKMGFYKNVSHHANKLKLRSILSIFTIGIFILFGFASISEETPVECDYYPQPLAKTHEVTIGIYDKETKNPIVNSAFKLNIIEYKKIDDIVGCKLEIAKEYTKDVTLNSSGKASFTLNKTYISKDDEIRIFFNIDFYGYNFSVESIKLKVNNLKQQYDYFILEDEEYP